ncbi:MAG: cation:proton antiporter [Kouleothrix sp.]|nr:cation:proton antiporter [Kouleothrix sp.]
MAFTHWYLLAGGLLIFMALAGSVLRRLPLTTAIVYLAVGLGLGSAGLGLLAVDPIADAALVERVSELAVLVSLFTAGLKLRSPLGEGRWRLPARLALGSMAITIGLIALAGVVGLGLPLGAAILLGAILAPTDPVLASDVQVEHPGDRDRLRFSLTGEAGLNDGTATPFVLLGLGLLGAHDLGAYGWRWLAVDLVWSVGAGLASGWLLGLLVGRLVLYLRREHKEAVGLDDFLALGLIALAYGAALAIHAYGFLAVFAAGLALRRIERAAAEDAPDAEDAPSHDLQLAGLSSARAEQIATDPRQAPAYMAQAVLGFNEQIERIGEVAVVVLLGGLLSLRYLSADALWFIPLLFLAIRPASVWLGLLGSRASRQQRGLMAWFGIRGVGSVYYLSYAIGHGLAPALAERLAGLTLSAVAVSIVIHGISVTPLMRLYERGRTRSAEAQEPEAAH